MTSPIARIIWLGCLVVFLTTAPSKCTELSQINNAAGASGLLIGSVDLPVSKPSSGLIQDTRTYADRGLEECECPDLATNFTCTCNSSSGVISTPSDADNIGMAELSYYIPSSESSVITIYFKKEDFSNLGSLCSFTIGFKTYADSKMLIDHNALTLKANTPLIVSGFFQSSMCKYRFFYSTYEAHINATTINNSSGVLTAPEDENGALSYRPNTQFLWQLTPEYNASKFKFTFNLLDLGGPYNIIHGDDKANQTEGDFLLIGPGEDVLGGSELMYYGRKEANLLRQVVTLGPTSHVFFYSSTNVFNASGFNISYEAIVDNITTPMPSTTTIPTPPEDLQTNTVTDFNGVLTPNKDYNEAEINGIIENFKKMVASMCTEYINMTKNISSTDVEVPRNETKRCNPYKCDFDTCISFNYSVIAFDANDNWIFTRAVLDGMMNDPKLAHHLAEFGENCEICEKPTRKKAMYIGIPVAVVLIGIVVSLAVRHLSAKDRQDDAHLKYEREMADRMDDNRRRSSADVSILGLGGSIASRGSRNSRRFTMPFPKPRMDDLDEEEDIDMSGYKEYDPDLGRVDPTQFGIHRDFLEDKPALKHYSNDAFVDDKDDETTVYRKNEQQQHLQEATVAAGTDSDDSDGGAVSFASIKRKNPSSTSITATAEVHKSEDKLSMQRRESDLGETSL